MRIGISGPQDFIALLIRRKWWIIGPFLALSSILAILITKLPNTYVSTTLILVKPREVPENFVVDLIAGSAETRLKTIEQILLSRANLKKIHDKFADQLPQYGGSSLDVQIARLRDDIKIVFQTDKAQTLTYFRISYQNQNAQLAQSITKELLNLILEQDRSTRQDQVGGTTEFFTLEREKVKGLLDESSRTLTNFKAGRQFELPENLSTNLSALDRLQLDKQGNTEAIDRHNTYLLNLELQIAQTPEFLTVVSAAPNAPVRRRAVSPNDRLIEDFHKAQDDYDKKAALNKAEYPDVLQAKARLERAKSKIPPGVLEAALKAEAEAQEREALSLAAEPSPAHEEKIPNPAYDKLQAELRIAQTELSARKNAKAFIEAQTTMYNRRVDATPQAELLIADVARENVELQKRLEDLNNKLGAAKLSESLETKQKGSTFFTQDEPNFPLDPSKPNKPAVFLGSCLFSLALSIALAFAIDIAHQRVRTQTEIEAIWGVPVLIDVPVLVTDSDLAALHKEKIRFAMYASMAVVLQLACLYVVNLKHNGILQTLEPVLQKLVYR